MKLIAVLLAVVFTTKAYTQTKELYFDPGEAWKEQSLNVETYFHYKRVVGKSWSEFPEKPFLNNKEIHHLRKEALKRHLSFKGYFHDRKFNRIRNPWLCLKSRVTFQSFTTLFEEVDDKYHSHNEKLDTVNTDFLVSLYNTRSYNVIRENAISYVPRQHGIDGSAWYVENIFKFKDDFIIEDSAESILLHYVNNPNLKIKTKEEEKEYILYYIYEELYDYRGVVAINTEDASDILFLGGPFLPLDNFLKEGFNISELRKGIPNSQGQIEWGARRMSYFIPSEYENRATPGFYTYGRILSYAFCNEIGREGYGHLQPDDGNYYEDGQATFKITCEPHYRTKCRYKEVGAYSGEESYFHYPNLLCSSYDGKIVESIKFRFDLNTYDIEFKIDERKDITNYPECSEKE